MINRKHLFSRSGRVLSKYNLKELEDMANQLEWPTDHTQYTDLVECGKGVSAKVYRANCRMGDDVKTVAVKQIDIERLDEKMAEEVLREAPTMMKIHHPNLIELYTSFMVDTTLWMIMPYAERGSLYNILEYRKTELGIQGLDEVHVQALALEVLKGVVRLHEDGILHRDIKAGNILVFSNGRVALTDLGVAVTTAKPQAPESISEHVVTTYAGSPCWMAPEVMQEVEYGLPADMWSFGMTLLELAYGKAPYANYAPFQILMKTIREEPPQLEEKNTRTGKPWSKELREVVRLCLQKDPALRPKAADLLELKYFKAYHKDVATVLEPMFRDLPTLEQRAQQLKQRAKNLPTVAEEILPPRFSNEPERTLGESTQSAEWDFGDDNDLKPQKSGVMKSFSVAQGMDQMESALSMDRIAFEQSKKHSLKKGDREGSSGGGARSSLAGGASGDAVTLGRFHVSLKREDDRLKKAKGGDEGEQVNGSKAAGNEAALEQLDASQHEKSAYAGSTSNADTKQTKGSGEDTVDMLSSQKQEQQLTKSSSRSGTVVGRFHVQSGDPDGSKSRILKQSQSVRSSAAPASSTAAPSVSDSEDIDHAHFISELRPTDGHVQSASPFFDTAKLLSDTDGHNAGKGAGESTNGDGPEGSTLGGGGHAPSIDGASSGKPPRAGESSSGTIKDEALDGKGTGYKAFDGSQRLYKVDEGAQSKNGKVEEPVGRTNSAKGGQQVAKQGRFNVLSIASDKSDKNRGLGKASSQGNLKDREGSVAAIPTDVVLPVLMDLLNKATEQQESVRTMIHAVQEAQTGRQNLLMGLAKQCSDDDRDNGKNKDKEVKKLQELVSTQHQEIVALQARVQQLEAAHSSTDAALQQSTHTKAHDPLSNAPSRPTQLAAITSDFASTVPASILKKHAKQKDAGDAYDALSASNRLSSSSNAHSESGTDNGKVKHAQQGDGKHAGARAAVNGASGGDNISSSGQLKFVVQGDKQQWGAQQQAQQLPPQQSTPQQQPVAKVEFPPKPKTPPPRPGTPTGQQQLG